MPSVLTIARFFSVFDPYFEGGNLWGVRAWREFGRRTKTDGLVCVLGSGVRPRQHNKHRLEAYRTHEHICPFRRALCTNAATCVSSILGINTGAFTVNMYLPAKHIKTESHSLSAQSHRPVSQSDERRKHLIKQYERVVDVELEFIKSRRCFKHHNIAQWTVTIQLSWQSFH